MSSTMEWIFISTTVLSIGISVMLYIFLQRQVRELRDGNQKLRLALSKKKYALKTKNLDLAFMGRGWQLNSKQIELKCKIAEGSTGIVWKGKLNKQWDVAVKIFRPGSNVYERSEIEFLMRTRHERLVMFVGMGSLERTKQKFIVSEYCECGTLSEMIWFKQREEISWIQSLGILSDIADGLAYLHLMHKSVHRDLKSPNVMLTQEDVWFRAKLADFSHSRIVYSGKRKTVTSNPKESNKAALNAASWERRGSTYRGTIRWMAPELMSEKECIYGPFVDIYSFAMIMWEILSLRKPWAELHYSDDIINAVTSGRRPKIPQICRVPEMYVDLMQRCWSQDIAKRPLIDVVCRKILDIRRREISNATQRYEEKTKKLLGTSTSSEEEESYSSHETVIFSRTASMINHQVSRERKHSEDESVQNPSSSPRTKSYRGQKKARSSSLESTLNRSRTLKSSPRHLPIATASRIMLSPINRTRTPIAAQRKLDSIQELDLLL